MPLPKRIDPIGRPLVRDRVYAALRDWIVRGTLRPNEKVRDTDLAARLGVSRTPVREALQRLEDEGFVRTAPNRWTRVSPLDVADARRLYPIIWTLEALAVRIAGARLDARDLRELADANDRLARALRQRNASAASSADRSFHAALVRRAQNEELSRILEDLKTKLQRLENTYFQGSIVARPSVLEHGRILDALRHHRIEQAAQALEANWRNSLDRLARHINRTATPNPLPSDMRVPVERGEHRRGARDGGRADGGHDHLERRGRRKSGLGREVAQG
jgi:DNA-binding GntR family transcriptional regulator